MRKVIQPSRPHWLTPLGVTQWGQPMRQAADGHGVTQGKTKATYDKISNEVDECGRPMRQAV
jgi:hypothetical protein